MISSSDFFHHHKKRIKPEQTPERDRYVRRTGKHAKKVDLVSSGVANLPAGIDTPQEFCRLLARNERKNGGLYEHEIALPRVLSLQQQEQLAAQLAVGLAGNSPVIWGLHCPRAAREGGTQPHVHALIYPKLPDGIQRCEPAQIFRRYNPKQPERGGWKKKCGGATRREVKEKLKAERATSCAIINECLLRNGIEQQLDHRSYADRDMKDTVPGSHLGPYKARKNLKMTDE